MNLKYYLRGLGVGIVVTSLILGIGLGSRKETLSNEEIKERARELGMVEESITVAEAAAQKEEEAQEAEVAPVPEENAESDAEPIVSAEPEVSSEPTMSTGAEPEVSSEPAVSTGAASEASEEPNVSAASEPAASATPEAGVKLVADEAEEDSGTAPEKEIVDITINPGEGSYVISQKLEQSGLIDDAAEYDAYLCDNGYHTKLRAGVHKIPMGSTREEIAKLLCR